MISGFALRQFYVGDFGCGMKMKFCGNILNLVHNAVAAEIMVLGMKSGPRLHAKNHDFCRHRIVHEIQDVATEFHFHAAPKISNVELAESKSADHTLYTLIIRLVAARKALRAATRRIMRV